MRWRPLLFTGIHCRTGHLVVDCEDQETANWLFKVGACLKTWTGIPLCVKLGDEVSLPYTFITFCLLGLLENQNKLDTSLWKIIARRNEGGGALLTIGIEEAGREGIEALSYQLAFRFGKITVNGLRKPKAETSPEQPPISSEE